MRVTIRPKAIILAKAQRAEGRGQCDGQAYCGMSNNPEMFLIYYLTMFTLKMHLGDKMKVLQQEYSQPPILPSRHFRWVVMIL